MGKQGPSQNLKKVDKAEKAKKSTKVKPVKPGKDKATKAKGDKAKKTTAGERAKPNAKAKGDKAKKTITRERAKPNARSKGEKTKKSITGERANPKAKAKAKANAKEKGEKAKKAKKAMTGKQPKLNAKANVKVIVVKKTTKVPNKKEESKKKDEKKTAKGIDSVTKGKNGKKQVSKSVTSKSLRLTSANLKAINEKHKRKEQNGDKMTNKKKEKKENGQQSGNTSVDSLNIPKLSFRAKDTWSGNSDDDGSVDSGVLDEDICFHCGKDTTGESDWGSLVLCDSCDGEYHLQCLGLDIIPRKSFRCPRCIEEEQAFQNLSFSVDSPRFATIQKRKKKFELCYSPSRPLDVAWEECLKKGFMVVSKLFPYQLIKKLTHGIVEKKTASGRVAEMWPGAIAEVSKRLNATTCSNVVDREGRFDIKLPDWLVSELDLVNILQPVVDKLRTVMGLPRPELRTHNVVFVPVGSTAQSWHMDDTVRAGKMHRYFTILIHLNPIDSDCGGTEIWVNKMKRGDMIRGRPGDAFVFNGSLMHRGQANTGLSHRFFYYASFACRADANTG